MRFIRLKIANYRGVERCEVEFDSSGITIIEGPNEAGKTSLGESIDLLFAYPDNSKHKRVKDTFPVDRDEGPEIELEAESGPYNFTYFKRFYKRPATELTITSPSSENLTGRDAHDRAREILSETVDVDLWEALMARQGEEITQPDLANQTSLSAALDRAAGGDADDSASDDLYERVEKEYSLYFDKRGGERKELQEARLREDNIESRIDELGRQLAGLERDIESSARLESEIAGLIEQEQQQSEAAGTHATNLEKIAGLEHELETAELRRESAAKSLEEAKRVKTERKVLIRNVKSEGEKLAELGEANGMATTSAQRAEDEFAAAREEFEAADCNKTKADSLARLRRDDHDFYLGQLNLDMLMERKQRIDEARDGAGEARQLLANSKIDGDLLKEIKKADRGMLEANARLQTGAPKIALIALDDCMLELDGENLQLDKDEKKDLTIADRSKLVVPGVVEIDILAGSSLENLNDAALKAQKVLDSLCQKAGVATFVEAQAAFDERVEANRKLEAKERVEADDLRDLTYDELETKIANLEAKVSGFLEHRVDQPAIAPNLETANVEKESSAAALDAAEQSLAAARLVMESAREVRNQLNSKLEGSQTEIRLLTDTFNYDSRRLQHARADSSDESLKEQVEQLRAALEELESLSRAALEAVAAENPEQIRALAETAEGSLKTTRSRLENTRTELTEVKTSLRIHGEEGLHEKLEEARRELDEVRSANRSLFARAAAADLLFVTMQAERDVARRAYVAPLKNAIERLGRLVYGDGCQVEINEDLQIANQTNRGKTVPFDSLSVGTKEQLALIFRLACCSIMAEDGGTPLVLDDALGNTDAERLKTMGAVLARCAREAQIIIFTCMPSRYSDVGEAKVVTLS